MQAFAKLIAASIAIATSSCMPANQPDHGPGTGNMAQSPPKLVLQITVDQLRGDLPTRYYDRLGDGGFRFLFENGVVYRNAHHGHANTETIIGHATLATGAHPSGHGMVGNLWFGRETGFTRYNVEDENYRLLTIGADVDAKTEIDYTVKTARSEGRSPATVDRAVQTVDVAPTLSAFLGIRAPSGSVGVPLQEVVEHARP